MPIYEYIHEPCQTVSEHVRSISRRDDPVACPECGQPMTRICASGMRLIGATPSRPIDMSKQLDKVFETNKEYRDYLAQPGLKEVDKKDLRPKIDKMKENKERKAQAQGYRSWRHRTQEIRKRQAMEAGKS